MGHALNCMKGGNIKLGHDQVRDECVHLCTMAYEAAGVKKEPFLRDASGNVRDKDLRADFLAIGVWERQRVAFFDNHRILDADAPSRFDRNTSYVTPCVPQCRRRRQDTWSTVRRWLGASHPWCAQWTGFSTKTLLPL